ncbi:MAG: beta-N-acetylhexosaminidase [Parvibaculaceae bacterium]
MAVGAFICGCRGPELTGAEIEFLRSAKPWGFILFKRNCETPEQIRTLTDAFRAAVGRRDAPVLIDQEGGRVQRLGPPLWRRYPPAAAFGRLHAAEPLRALRAAWLVTRLLAEDLRKAGITVDCLPVLDIPQPGSHDIIGDRAYATDVAVASLLARSAMQGLLAGGVLPVIKHIPGHGRATADSHLSLPVVGATRSELEQTDFPPFAALSDAPMAMTAHVVYTAIDPDAPATLSKALIESVIRRDIGFNGLLMSDDLSMQALSGSLGERTKGALAAGCDVALHCNGNLDEMREVAAAAGPLRGAALARARRALKALRPPRAFDREFAEAEAETLCGVAAKVA